LTCSMGKLVNVSPRRMALGFLGEGDYSNFVHRTAANRTLGLQAPACMSDSVMIGKSALYCWTEPAKALTKGATL